MQNEQILGKGIQDVCTSVLKTHHAARINLCFELVQKVSDIFKLLLMHRVLFYFLSRCIILLILAAEYERMKLL